MAYAEETARNMVTEAARRLLEAGLVARTWGNISARISDTQFVITPSGMGYEHMSPDDLVTVNIADGSWEGSRKPSSEKGIHADAYRLRPEVNFVIHTHQEAASIWGITGMPLTGMERAYLGEVVPCAGYGMPSTRKLRKAVAEVMEKYPYSRAFLMKYHGALCLGEGCEEAFAVAGELEEVCREKIASVCKKTPQKESKAADYGKSIRKDGKFCLYLDGGKTVYHLKRMPKQLPEAAAVHGEIYRKTDASCVIWTADPAVREFSSRGIALRPYLEDLIQIAGVTIRCTGGISPAEIAGGLGGRNAVLVFGEGAFCTGPTKEDAEAVAALLEKGCRAALFAETEEHCVPVGYLDGWIQRLVYVKKYARKKEER